jgi:hypothetical protein
MDIHTVKVSQQEIDTELERAKAAAAASFSGDACEVYRQARPALEVAIPILGLLYPPAAAAVAALKVILDKACEVS